jgi:small GTP-binding protein
MAHSRAPPDHKIVFLGDSNTGKTTIIYKYLNLTQHPFPTIAASSFPIEIAVADSVIHLNCWDTAGQESYRCLVPIYARNAEVACLVFDQSNLASFESLDKWLHYIRSDVGVSRVLLVSNKSDLDPAVPADLVLDFCLAHNLQLITTSALTGTNITFLFKKIAEIVHADLQETQATAKLEVVEKRAGKCC